MEKHPLAIRELNLQPFTTFDPDGILLVSGQSPEQANVMTISWGTFGIMWGKPVVMVMVRPTRHTWQFITRAEDFTVNWMSQEFTAAVQACGTTSGRDMNKFAVNNLHPVRGIAVNSPVIAESILTLECRIIYRDEVKPGSFIDPALENNYPGKDYHSLFFGEIVAAAGSEQFHKA